MHRQQTSRIDPAAGEPGLVVAQEAYGQPIDAMQAAQSFAPQPVASPSERGFFNSRPSAPVSPQVQQPYVLQYGGPRPATTHHAAPQPDAPQYAEPQYTAPPAGGAYAAVASGRGSASPYAPAYTLDSGDKLRIVVFGQDGISNSYIVDAGGNVNLPLIGAVPARGYAPQQLSKMIADRLKQGYVREPHVTVEVETYRPFFILGEVTNPGQYPYVADMTVEKAVAIAGGFAPRASKNSVEITRSTPGQQFKAQVPLSYPMRPGDTVLVQERWF